MRRGVRLNESITIARPECVPTVTALRRKEF
jgi:hypothetical protein